MQVSHIKFYFGVLHPVARTLSRLLEEPSLPTTVQGVYLYLHLAATCFGFRWPSSGGIHNILGSYLSHNGSVAKAEACSGKM
jgi:hypothetical protein